MDYWEIAQTGLRGITGDLGVAILGMVGIVAVIFGVGMVIRTMNGVSSHDGGEGLKEYKQRQGRLRGVVFRNKEDVQWDREFNQGKTDRWIIERYNK